MRIVVLLLLSACSSSSDHNLPTYGWAQGTSTSGPNGSTPPDFIGAIATPGDSITWGPEICPSTGPSAGLSARGEPCQPGTQFSNGGWRRKFQELAAADHIGVEMVGTIDAGPDSMAQRATDGHSGAVLGGFNPDGGDPYMGTGRFEIDTIVDKILTDFRPTLWLQMLGINEVAHESEADFADRCLIEIRHVLDVQPNILVGILLPIVPPDEPMRTNTMTLRAALTDGFQGFDRRVAIIDAGGAVDGTTQLYDNRHPTMAASDAMGEVIYQAVKPLASH